MLRIWTGNSITSNDDGSFFSLQDASKSRTKRYGNPRFEEEFEEEVGGEEEEEDGSKDVVGTSLMLVLFLLFCLWVRKLFTIKVSVAVISYGNRDIV